MKKAALILLLFCALVLIFVPGIYAESCTTTCSDDNLDKCAAECQKLIDISISATKPHEQTAQSLEKEITSIDTNIKSLGILLDKKQAVIAANEKKFAAQQLLLSSQVRDFYKKNWTSQVEYFLVTVFSQEGIGETINNLAYRQTLIDQQKKLITSLVLNLSELRTQQKSLEASRNWLAAKQTDLQITLAPIRKLVNEAKAYQTQLTKTLGVISTRQQQLIAAKIGSLNLSRSANISMACSDDRKIDPGFSPAFAFYTFGIPHRVGMSQFGAYGRARDGQDYRKILNAYFNGVSFDKKSNIDIEVQGFGRMAIEQYMLGIYEVPNDWPMEALKAQAVAARSYALAYTNNGANSICTTQECQVYKGGNKGGNWEQAVKQTEGEVLTSSGKIIKAWYSSTDGGYTHPSSEVFGGTTAWTKNLKDTSGDINSINDLFSKAYDRDSPCFYNAQGWRPEYNKSAWLKAEEVADIVNVILVSAKTNDWDSWDANRVKQELGSSAFNRIDSVSMSFDLGAGKTTSVTLTGDAGSKTFDGQTFKDYFNVRAPANIAIVGPLYNIEKK